ncbi:MAG TPA: diaminopimelate epimerase [Mycobacteriales bacterium]|nr:diaminopimelate epimerase [Mycobacteriales bacterium]
MGSTGLRFIKAHGTENDFVLLPEGQGELDAATVRRLCDRRAGIGADGVLRVVREDGGFFMDYRNADGSVAETCGNGLRVFARYLVDAGLLPPGRIRIGTRSGVRLVDVPADGGDITAELGPAAPLTDATVLLGGRSWPAAGWSMGNPHLVVLDAGDIDALDLATAPGVDPAAAYPDGVNVEFCQPLSGRRLALRVVERGVGETRSCGTGAGAAAVAALAAAGARGDYDVRVPGGELRVRWDDDGDVWLTGPAVLVAEGQVDADVLAAWRNQPEHRG